MTGEPQQQFAWLLEVCTKEGLITKPAYVNKLGDGLTADAWLAHWFAETERDVAMKVAARLPLPPGLEFRFIEHGFIS